MTANPRHDAPLVIVGRADRNPNRAWSRPLTIADELGPRQPVPQADPVDETWASLIANGCAFVFVLLAIGMTLVVIGGVR